MASPGARVMPIYKEKKSKAEIARDLATEKQREQRNGEIKKLTAAYAIFAFVGMALIITGVTSTSWYLYEEVNESLTTSGDKVFYEQEWGMGIYGVTIMTQYCVPGGGDCLPDLDLHMYFDNTKNTVRHYAGLLRAEQACGAAGLRLAGAV